jgi:hypothetical protein
MINHKNKEKKNKGFLNNSNQYNKLKQRQGVSKLLEIAIEKYQFDIVGWTEFCIDNKNLKQKALPKYRKRPFENLRIQDRNLSSFTSPPLKKIYESPDSYVQYLDKEYIRDQAFYEAILKNPGKYKADIKDNLLNEEIDKSAKKYLKSIKKRKVDEEALIRTVKPEDWLEIKKSKYPKVQLGLMLGASKEAIIKNFGLYFINQLKANFLGTRTAYLSSTGPTSWHEIERCEAELTYFEKMVVEPIIKKLKL